MTTAPTYPAESREAECDAVRIEKLTVLPGRIACDVVVDTRRPYTDAAFAARLCERVPTIVRHSCISKQGAVFGDVISCTSLAHVLEHLVIDLQASYGKSSDTLYMGTTEWVDEGKGIAHVEVSFTDDLVALRSFRDAMLIINETVIE